MKREGESPVTRSFDKLPALLSVLALVAGASPGAARPARVLWDCDNAEGTEGVTLEQRNVRRGQGAIRWQNHPKVRGFSVPDVPRDWCGYNLLRLWIHNARPVPTRFMIIVPSENPNTEGSDYWSYGVRLDFTGWKELVFPIGGRNASRKPRGWDQVDGLRFTASGWGNTPHPGANVLIDDIRLKYDPPRPGPRMTDREFFRDLDLSRPDLAAVREAVDAGRIEEAKAAFLAHMRSRTGPTWRIDWRDRPEVQEIPAGGSDGWDYFATSIKIDWTGWKEVTLPLKRWNRARKPIGWHYINNLRFSSSYGDRTPSPNTALTFDDIELVGEKRHGLGDFETTADFRRWQTLTATTNQVHGGKQAGLWSHLPARQGLALDDVPRNWRGFTALRMWVHSALATGDIITLAADSEPPDTRAADAVVKHMYWGHHLGDDIDWTSNRRDPSDPAFTREWTYSLNRFDLWQTLGRAYWQTGDEKYAREWIAQMRDWVEDNPYLLYGTGNNTLTWRTIEAGIRCSGSWPDSLQYFLGSPSLKPDDLVVFMKSWIEHARHLMRITLEHPAHGGNWVTMECNGLGHLGILLPECRDAREWLRTAADRLNDEIDRQVYPDGAQKELTTGYHQVARRNFVELYQLAHRNGTAMPGKYLAGLERMYDYNLKAMTPEGRLPPLNDASYTRTLDSLKEGAGLFGREEFHWGATRGLEGKPPAYTSVAFPYAGQYVMRSGWERDDLYMLFESGPFGIGHQHEDKLSMFVYGLGRVLLTEAGTYSYDQSRYRRYVLGTWAHNTILVDGQQQHRRGLRETYETDKPLDNLWISTDRFDAADGLYENGYGPKRDKSVAHERLVVFVRPDYWIVVDWLHALGEHTYDILWHLNNDSAEHDPQTLAAWGADAGVASLLITPARTKGLSLEIVKGREDPVLGFAPARSKKPIPVLNYKLRARGSTRMVWVLTPYRDSRPAVRVTCKDADGGVMLNVGRAGKIDAVHVYPRDAGRPADDRVRIGRP
jgi:hypothetical protein